MSDDRADRYNGGKVPMSHVLDYPHLLIELAKVADYGARKYSRGNYLKGQDISVTMDSLMRHLTKWWSGEEDDEESGISHLAHAAWNLATLIQDTSDTADVHLDDRALVGEFVTSRIAYHLDGKGCD